MNNKRTLLTVIFFLLVFAGGALNAYADIPGTERDALIALYNSTDGDNWTNKSGWKDGDLAGDGFAMPGTEGTWYGIQLTAGGNGVHKITLVGNNLSGTIPADLGSLSSLEQLYLYNNQLTGSIPSQLGTLSNLLRLSLNRNQISGSIPPEIGSLSSIGNIDLYGNQLTGSIPAELGNLSNLTTLNLKDNQLEGSIPEQLGSLSSLRTLYLSNNHLTGEIPSELGSLSNLTHLVLDTNELTGDIPLELANLTKVQLLALNNNQLSGNIPPELGTLSDLEQLDLSFNQFDGSIPPELGNLSNLTQLRLYFNDLLGSIPSELGNLSNLEDLYLQNNHLTGSIPEELGSMTTLVQLYLDRNQLEGNIPKVLGFLPNLSILSVANNRLTGSIPTKLTNLSSLTLIDLEYNALFTDDETLRTFLNGLQSGWEDTQTIAPQDVSAAPLSSSSINVGWTPIAYTGHSGGYRVFYGQSTNGPYTPFGATGDKSVSQLEVTGLTSNTQYYFVVQTWTDPHDYNENTVESEFSEEAMATTYPLPSVSGRATISIAGHSDLSITNATVVLVGTSHTTTTDSNGNFALEDLVPGTYTLMVSAPNLVPLSQEIELSEGQQLLTGDMEMTVLTQSDLDQAVQSAVESWDVGGDGKIELKDIIYWLQVLCGMRSQP